MTDRRVDITIKGHDESAAATAGIEKLNAKLESLSHHAAHALEALLGFEAIKGGVEAFGESELANARLASVLNATGEAAGFSAESLLEYSEHLQTVTTFSHVATTAAETTLAAFRNIKGDVFLDAVKASQDLASALDGDLTGAAERVGKALSDPGKGLKGLRQFFSPEEREQLKGLAASGHLLEAQTQILDRLKGTAGGAAEAIAHTGTGQLRQFGNIIKDVEEAFGAIFVPVLTTINSVLRPALEKSKGVFDAIAHYSASVFDASLPFWKTAGEYMATVFDYVGLAIVNWRGLTEIAIETVIVKVRELGDVFSYIFTEVIPTALKNVGALIGSALSDIGALYQYAGKGGAMSTPPPASATSGGGVSSLPLMTVSASPIINGIVNISDLWNAVLVKAFTSYQMTKSHAPGGQENATLSGTAAQAVKELIPQLTKDIPAFKFGAGTEQERAILDVMKANLVASMAQSLSGAHLAGVPIPVAPRSDDEDSFSAGNKGPAEASTSHFVRFGYQSPDNAAAEAVKKQTALQQKKDDEKINLLQQIFDKLTPVTEQPFGANFFGV